MKWLTEEKIGIALGVGRFSIGEGSLKLLDEIVHFFESLVDVNAKSSQVRAFEEIEENPTFTFNLLNLGADCACIHCEAYLWR